MARQGSCAHWVQLQTLGVTRGQVTTRLVSGSWAQPYPSVFSANGAAAGDIAIWSAWLAASYGARGIRRREVAVARQHAAQLLRVAPLPLAVRGPVELVVPYGARAAGLPGVRLRRVRDWDARGFVTLAGGLLVTSRTDTVADLAALLRRPDLLALVQAQAWEHPGLLAALDARAGCGRAGSASLRSVVAAVRGGIDSTLHERGIGLVLRAGLPRPVCDRELVPGLGVEDCVIERPGAIAPPWGIVIGWSGDVHRVERRKHVHDRRRGQALRRSGWVHFDYGIDDVTAAAPTEAELRSEWRRQSALPPSGDGRLSA